MSGCFDKLGDASSAVRQAERALTIVRALGSTTPGNVNHCRASVEYSLGLLYQRSDRATEAAAILQSAQLLYAEEDDNYGIAASLLARGDIYRGVGQFERAIDCINRTASLCKDTEQYSVV